jgi:hypothetical protein
MMTADKPRPAYQEEALLEQYKLYVQLADNVSERRAKTNAYYVSVTAAILVLAARFEWLAPADRLQAVGLLLVAVLGILVCLVWRANVTSFRQLNSAKFKVIHELEERLPFPCYDREWELLRRGTDRKSYLQLTRIERALPLVLTIAYLMLLVIAIARLVDSP